MTLLYFIRLSGPGACNKVYFRWNLLALLLDWIEYFKNLHLYQLIDACLINSGWNVLEWSNRIPDHMERPHMWHDSVHPKARLVEDIIVGWIRDIQQHQPTTESVLLVGDSTTAHCFDRTGEISSKNLAFKVKQRTGVNIWIGSISGRSFTERNNFTEQIQWATSEKYRYDAVLLVGGWNQSYNSNAFTKKVFDKFHSHAVSALYDHLQKKATYAFQHGVPEWSSFGFYQIAAYFIQWQFKLPFLMTKQL
jgi:hypothetical protein